jgi:hypothetical protein
MARRMALAIRCDQLIRSGAVADGATLAGIAHVTRARMTQIMNLTLLAPDIQESLLNLPPVVGGKPVIGEKVLRPVCAEVGWDRQRRRMRRLTASATGRVRSRP